MNRLCLRSLVMLFLAAILSGCFPNFRTGQICFITGTPLDCDYEALLSHWYPKPFSNRWEKEGVSYVERIIDWKYCGGNYDGDSDDRYHEILAGTAYDAIEICMIKEGYRYMGHCGIEIGEHSPACQARKNTEQSTR